MCGIQKLTKLARPLGHFHVDNLEHFNSKKEQTEESHVGVSLLFWTNGTQYHVRTKNHTFSTTS